MEVGNDLAQALVVRLHEDGCHDAGAILPSAPFGGAPCQSSNVHTHGLLVSPYKADDLQGDFVPNLSSPTPPDAPDACASPQTAMHAHGDIVDTLKYRIRIPRKAPTPASALNSGNHPSGLFWMHPHPHGYSASQLTGGTAGLITVGIVGSVMMFIPVVTVAINHPGSNKHPVKKD